MTLPFNTNWKMLSLWNYRHEHGYNVTLDRILTALQTFDSMKVYFLINVVSFIFRLFLYLYRDDPNEFNTRFIFIVYMIQCTFMNFACHKLCMYFQPLNRVVSYYSETCTMLSRMNIKSKRVHDLRHVNCTIHNRVLKH